MPYTVDCTPAPVTFTIWPKFDWKFLPSIGWGCFVVFQLLTRGWRNVLGGDILYIITLVSGTFVAILALIRRERVEIYPDRMVWRKTYFGISRSKTAALNEVLGAEWDEGVKDGDGPQAQPHIEFFLTTGTVKACFGCSFEDFDQMRQHIRSMYPQLVDNWTRSSVHSKTFTLLNLN